MEDELRRTPTKVHRYMYSRILWKDRMIGIVGPRGVGKSTMVKQYMLKQPDRKKWLYVSADHSETVLKFFHRNLRRIFEMVFQCEEEA